MTLSMPLKIQLFACAALLACLSPKAALASADEDRKEINEMRTQILQRLYKEEPSTKALIRKAAGYATFSNIGVNLIFLSAGGGSGVVRDNATGQDIYMKMGTAGVGIGLGVKDFSAVFVFHSKKALNNFVEYGWDFSGQADAAAKSGKKGSEGSAAVTVIKEVDVYQMTENGLALQATLQGTKYWKNDKLN
ncbi:YSC84-related protein [Thalassotalea euphylliae]|nr:YSC84-related protein [Thalassotalea euphylliae]